MKEILAAALLAGLAVAATATAHAGPTETITATFTQPDGGVTANGYDDQVLIDVSGVGQSDGSCYNDAFYSYSCPPSPYFQDAWYYQLTFGVSPLTPFDPDQNAVNFIVGGVPAYSPTHDYSFSLNTGVDIPTLLHFGVGDGAFSDNSGAYTITIKQLPTVSNIPEPLTLSLFGAGLAGAMATRRRRKTA
jgi:hypothetical protein